MPGKSIIEKIKSEIRKFDYIILPSEALNENGLFIDDVSLEDVRRSCVGRKIFAALSPSEAIEIIEKESR